MRVLVGWENPSEAETIDLILNVNEVDAEVVDDDQKFLSKANDGWDAIVMSLSFPSNEQAFELFEQVTASAKSVPVIGVWKQGEIGHLAKFIAAGLHSHLMRDADGSFIMLFRTMIEAAIAAMEAQRSIILAGRLREEVESVRRLQENVIPHDLPQPTGYKIAAKYEPSQIRVLGTNPVAMAGGDYYDVFHINDDRMILLVGDASGHGVKACMSIMTMHTLIRMIRTNKYPNTADFVAEINRRLCRNQIVHDEGGFITLLYSTLNFKNHKLTWTSAGAPIPLVQDLATNTVTLIGDNEDDGGLPLAILEDFEYDEHSFEVPPNSRLLIFTDGLDEAFPMLSEERTGTEIQFGLEGIIESLKNSVSLPVDQALQKLFDDSNEFTQGAGRMDDTSVVLFERT
jgi:sigma-B regulation protein RsbU (phosphoserine phosphatase)